MLDAAQFEHLDSGDPRQGWRMFHREESFGYLWHFHPQYEITLITAGAGTRYVGDSIEDFTSGDLTLIGPNLPHTYVSSAPASALCSQFDDNLLGTEWTGRPEFADVADLLARSARGLRFEVRDPADWWHTYSAEPARRTQSLLGHLIELAGRDDGQPLTSAQYGPRLDRRTMTRLDDLLDHIDRHLADTIRLDDLAEVAFLSPAATSRFFRRQTGHTIGQYVNRTRVAAACRMLIAGDDPIGRIAGNCGFANLANFHRQFRKLTGVTPGAFRKQPTRLVHAHPEGD